MNYLNLIHILNFLNLILYELILYLCFLFPNLNQKVVFSNQISFDFQNVLIFYFFLFFYLLLYFNFPNSLFLFIFCLPLYLCTNIFTYFYSFFYYFCTLSLTNSSNLFLPNKDLYLILFIKFYCLVT
jgi:hypothetical protein